MYMYDARWFNHTWTLPIGTLKSSRKDKKCTNHKVIKDKMTNVIAEILKKNKERKSAGRHERYRFISRWGSEKKLPLSESWSTGKIILSEIEGILGSKVGISESREGERFGVYIEKKHSR